MNSIYKHTYSSLIVGPTIHDGVHAYSGLIEYPRTLSSTYSREDIHTFFYVHIYNIDNHHGMDLAISAISGALQEIQM